MANLERKDPRPLYEGIDAVHQAIHGRGMYTISKTFLAVASNGFADIHFSVPEGYEAHTRTWVASTGKAYFKTYRGSTYTTNGVVITPFNRAMNDTSPSLATAWHTPTGVVVGVLRDDDLVNGSTGGNSVGGNQNQNFETIVAPLTDYLIRVQNAAGVSADINISINYYLRKTT